MVFSSVNFLYYFLPLLLIIYFAVPSKVKNLVLFSFSIVFYFYGEPLYTILLIGASLSGYVHGRLIDYYRGTRYSKGFLVSSIIVGIGLLGFFKYANFFIENINVIFDSHFALLRVVLPIGISFYTFQVLSYTIDVYRGEVAVQKNALDFMTYVALFPQLIAGPIVRYETIEHQLRGRTHSFSDLYYGIRRFVVGLGKKVLIANTLAEVVVHFNQADQASILFFWLAAIAFMLQIYYDFSGYSDMAIGLGRMFGFRFPENFNYPYIAKSVTEFWRRWHISLGMWFRRYVYIPLGGNRVNVLKLFRNILIVWFLTGFWHGAAWNFIVWGVLYGVLLLFEKLVLKENLNRIPGFLRHIYVLFVVLIGFVLFNADSLSEGMHNIRGMLGLLGVPLTTAESIYYLRSYGVVILIACIGSTPLIAHTVKKLRNHGFILRLSDYLEPAATVLLILMVTANLVDGSFNPFIYFRF